MILLQLLAWLHPLLLIALSFVSYRHLPLRRQRFVAYFLFLFVACFMDIFSLSLKIDIIDIIAQRLIIFMLAEYLWMFSAVKHRAALSSTIAVVCIFVGACTWRWLIAGPADVREMWTARMDSTYHHGAVMYVLKDRHVPTLKGYARRYILSRYLRRTPLERRVDDWVTADGYANTPFTYSWQPHGEGVKLDLIDAGTAIWSLGEGL